MAQIGFTHKSEEIYNRFQDMRREYELLHGRTYAPDFLTVLMDVMEYIHQLNTARVKWISYYPKTAGRFVLEVTEDGIRLYQVHPDREGDEWVEINKPKPASLRAYIANAEANEPNLKPEKGTE